MRGRRAISLAAPAARAIPHCPHLPRRKAGTAKSAGHFSAALRRSRLRPRSFSPPARSRSHQRHVSGSLAGCRRYRRAAGVHALGPLASRPPSRQARSGQTFAALGPSRRQASRTALRIILSALSSFFGRRAVAALESGRKTTALTSRRKKHAASASTVSCREKAAAFAVPRRLREANSKARPPPSLRGRASITASRKREAMPDPKTYSIRCPACGQKVKTIAKRRPPTKIPNRLWWKK